MKIFLTGQKGFIGQEILSQARYAGHEVMGLERPFRMENPPWGAIEDFSPDVCIHSAWIATPGEYTTSPLNKLHRKWSADLIKGLAKCGVRHVVVLGTCAEYAPSDSPLSEEGSTLAPSSPYAQEKAALHDDLLGMDRESGFTHSWARIFYPYGLGEHPDRLISSLIRGWKSNHPLQLKNPECVRDYIHVKDVASALLLLAIQLYQGTVNVGTGSGIRLGTLDAMIRDRLGVVCPEGANTGASTAKASSDAIIAECKKLKDLGWHPYYDIKKGIDSYFDFSAKDYME